MHLRAELTALLDAWAVALVQLHRRPVTAQTPPAPLPWVLTDPLPAWLDELPAAAGPAWAVRAHPGTARALAAARSGWRPVQSTHGDATGDAVRVSRSSGRLRAVLQPEPGGPGTGRVGDPRWDVATALDWLAIALSPAVDESWHVDAAEMFVRCYQLAGRRRRTDATDGHGTHGPDGRGVDRSARGAARPERRRPRLALDALVETAGPAGLVARRRCDDRRMRGHERRRPGPQGGPGLRRACSDQAASSSDVRFRVLFWSTRMPGPFVVEKVALAM